MAAKYLILVSVIAAVSLATDDTNNCDCDSADTKALWEYLTKISQNFDDLTEEEKGLFAVPPGLLSLFECECPDKSRRRRSLLPLQKHIQPAVVSTPKKTQDLTTETPIKNNVVSSTTSHDAQDATTVTPIENKVVSSTPSQNGQDTTTTARYESKIIQRRTRYCPRGYIKIIHFCVKEEDYDY